MNDHTSDSKRLDSGLKVDRSLRTLGLDRIPTFEGSLTYPQAALAECTRCSAPAHLNGIE